MTALELTQQAYHRLVKNIYKSFDKIIAAMPTEKMGTKPSPENMSFAQVALHVYQTALMVARAIKTGCMNKEDMYLIATPKEITPAAILDYGAQVKQHLEQAIDSLSQEEAQKAIPTPFGMAMTPLRLLQVLQEEAIHHRGQLTVYLRLQGIKPPSIYDYS
ncbi:MAG: DinB family protein [Cytophagales bacterium]|nr:DinB family protein [Bernardetiaceae bacterium]MDW8210098.1 DinB family protein [Cytophagales bacterium]